MKKVGVAILGLGTVGGGTYEILTKNHDVIKANQGLDITVEAVLELNRQRALSLGVPEENIYSNIAEVVTHPAVDVVVEVIGGVEPAKTFILAALSAGKTVVTANKELIAKHWDEIETIAREYNSGFYFEASCVGGVPIIRTLIDGMQANNITSLVGIINGTTNYILTKMSDEGLEYADVLKEAQKLGYAEANPTADVEGFDVAYKLTILSSLAFSKKVHLENVHREGISQISKIDIEYGKQLGYTLKLLAIGKNSPAGIEARVHPAFIKNDSPLASVKGSFNAVLLKGDMVDDIMLYGRGAGALPTGSAIVSDIVYAAKQTEHYYVPFKNVPGAKSDAKFAGDFESEYYVRMDVSDECGVLSEITAQFGKYKVSMHSVLQKDENDKENSATIIFITHKTSEKNFMKAIGEIKKLSNVHSVDAIIRVEK